MKVKGYYVSGGFGEEGKETNRKMAKVHITTEHCGGVGD